MINPKVLEETIKIVNDVLSNHSFTTEQSIEILKVTALVQLDETLQEVNDNLDKINSSLEEIDNTIIQTSIV